MFRPALAAVGRILLRSQAAAAGSPLRPAGASRLRHLHSQQGSVAATAGHRFGFFVRNLKPRDMAVAGWSTAGVGLWYMKNLPRWAEVDWVEAGVVSPVVRNQKDCGSCGAMAAADSVEAVHYLNTLQSITLSVQELIDCDTRSNGCEGGYPENALRYIRKNGVTTEYDYPYMARKSKSGCERNTTAPATRISGFRFVNPTEDDLKKAVAKQPVIVTLRSCDDLRKYKGGILDYKVVDGKTYGWHAVLLVGYGTDSNGIKFWRFKNSWGPKWGEEGFGRIRRHVDDKRGPLGIFMGRVVYPVLKD